MKQIMNKLFKRNLTINEDQVEFDPTFDLDLRTMVAAVIPGESFEEQLETQILEMAAANNKNNAHASTQKQADWFSLNTSVKKFSLVGLTIVLIMAISLLVSPSLRVMAENIFSFWKKVDNQQVITPFPEVPAIDPEEIPAIVESLQEEIKSTQQAITMNSEEEYIIKLPSLLPEGHRVVVVDRGPFGNAFLDLSGGRVLMTVTIKPAYEVQGKILGPEEKVERITIDNITYEYVRGGWGIGNAFSGLMDPDAVKDLSWIDDYDGMHKLRWIDGNMSYYMLVGGSSLPGQDWYLGMNDMVKIASSFQPLENGKRPPLDFFEPDHGIDEKPFENIKDISVLEDLVRFNIPEASVLPGNFSFKNGKPVFTGNHVIMYYSCTDDAVSSEEMNEFWIEFTIGRYTETALTKEFEMFGGYEVGEDAFIETILINDVEVQYVRGGWAYQAGKRTWDNNLKQFKMIWYQDGLLYHLHNTNVFHDDQGSCAITKANLVEFVESVQKDITENVYQPPIKPSSPDDTTENTEEEYIIKLPTLLPEGYRIVTVSNGPNGNAWVDLSRINKGIYFAINIQPASLVENSIIGPADKIEKVAINDLTGEYVRGGYGVGAWMTGYVKEEDAKNLTWLDDGRIHKLGWNDGNMNYLMIFQGSDDPGSPRYLGKNDMAKIAASMIPVENGIRPTVESFVPDNGKGEEPVPYIKDFSILKRLVSFDVPEPTYIPEKYTFDGGETPFTGTVIFEYFSCTPEPGELDHEIKFGFMLQMNKISEQQLEQELSSFADEIGEEAVIETILIDGIEVQYIKGDWVTTWVVQNGTSVPQDSVWDNDAYWHRMKWYKNGVLYTLRNYLAIQPDYNGSCALTKEDLIKFVEGLQ